MKRVLALVPGDIDNQILFFPTFETLRTTYPDIQIDVVAEARAVPVYRIYPSVRKAMRFEFSELNSFADWSNLLGQMRDQDYDVVLSAATRWSMGWALWMSGIPQRIGFSGCGAAFAFTQSVPLKPDQYLAYTYHDLLQGLNLTPPCPSPSLTIPDKDLVWAESEQKYLGVEPRNYLLIDARPSGNAQGSYPTYPVEQWQTILQTLSQRHPDLPILLVQPPNDHELFLTLRTVCPALKAATLEDVGKLAGLLKDARLLLCLENAALQLAVTLGTPAIALFDSTAPTLLLPQGSLSIGLTSTTGKIADIQPHAVLEQIEQELRKS